MLIKSNKGEIVAVVQSMVTVLFNVLGKVGYVSLDDCVTDLFQPFFGDLLAEAGFLRKERAREFDLLAPGEQVRELSRVLHTLTDFLDSAYGTGEEGQALIYSKEGKWVLRDFVVNAEGIIDDSRIPEYVLPEGYSSWKEVRREARRSGQELVDSEWKMEELRPRLIHKPGRQASQTTLLLNDDDTTDVVVAPWTVNAETPVLEKTVAPARVMDNAEGDMRQYDRYSYAYLNVSVDDPVSLRYLENGAILFRCLHYKNGEVDKEGFYVLTAEPFQYSDGEKEHEIPALYDLVQHKLVPGTLVYDENGDVRDRHSTWWRDNGFKLLVYTPVGGHSSNGQEKNGEFSFLCFNLPKLRAWGHLNKMTQGAMKIATRHLSGAKLKAKKIMQLATRGAQFSAPARTLKPIGGICIVMAEVTDKSGYAYMDGLDAVSAEYMADALSDKDYKIMPWAVDGSQAQNRPLWMTKCLGKVKSRRRMKEWLEENNVKVEFIFREDVTPEVQAHFNDAVFNQEGPFALTDEDKAVGYRYKAVFVIDGSRWKAEPMIHDGFLYGGVEWQREELLDRYLDVLTDLNGYKTATDLRRHHTGLNMIELSHGPHSLTNGARTANQMIQTMMIADPDETRKVLMSLAKESFASVMDKSLCCGEGRTPSFADLHGNLQMAVQDIIPEVMDVWAPYFQDNLNKRCQGWSTTLERLNIPTDGGHFFMLPDFGYGSGIRLLKHVKENGHFQVFSKALEKEGIRQAVLNKFPKCGFEEFVIGDNRFTEELVQVAREAWHCGLITRRKFMSLKHEIRSFQNGSIMLPCYDSLNHMLAGYDNDGDSCQAFTDKRIVAIYSLIRSIAVYIKESLKKDIPAMNAEAVG